MNQKYSEVDKWFKENMESYAPDPTSEIWAKLDRRLQDKQKHPSFIVKILSSILIMVFLFGTWAVFKHFDVDNSKLSSTNESVLADSSKHNSPKNEGINALKNGVVNNEATALVNHEQKNIKRSEKSHLQNEAHSFLENALKSKSYFANYNAKTKDHNFLKESVSFYSNDLTTITDKIKSTNNIITTHTFDPLSTSEEYNPPIKPISQFHETDVSAMNPTIGPNFIRPLEVDHYIKKDPKPNQLLSPSLTSIQVYKKPVFRWQNIGLMVSSGSSFRKLFELSGDVVTIDDLNRVESKASFWSAQILMRFGKASWWSMLSGIGVQSSSIVSKNVFNIPYLENTLTEGIYATSFKNYLISIEPQKIDGITQGSLIAYDRLEMVLRTTAISIPTMFQVNKKIGIFDFNLATGIHTNFIIGQRLSIQNGLDYFERHTQQAAEENATIYFSSVSMIDVSFPTFKSVDLHFGYRYEQALTSANKNKAWAYLPNNQSLFLALSKRL